MAVPSFWLSASSDETTSTRRNGQNRSKTAATDDDEQPVVRLNFVSAPWQQVLQHVADETDSTLVIHDLPEGRYSRRDIRRHTRTEAVQILNQHLEPLGYRILETNEFLTVIEIQRARLEYPRHAVQTADSQHPTESTDTEDVQVQEPAHHQDVGRTRLSAEPEPSRKHRRPIRAAGFEATDSEPDSANASPANDDGAADTQSADSNAVERVTVNPNRPVTDIAKQVYAAFGERAELVPTDAGQLPAFRVYREITTDAGESQREIWFILEMDSAVNELYVHAPPETAAGVGALLRKLDAIPPRDGEIVRLVPEAEQATALAQQLNAQLAVLRSRRRTAPEDNPFLLAQADEPRDDAATQPSEPSVVAGDIEPPPGEAPEVLGNLRGDVSVDALADLDLLILRGNERDIDAVMAVIAKIEEMAIGATPGIELFFLQNVDSEALAALLNDVYTRLTTLSTGTAASARQSRAVNVVAVGSPNAVLILAPQNTIDSVLDLAEQLDQPQSPGTEVEVFFLRNAVATQVVTLLEGFYEERPGLGTNIRVVADARTNSVIVNASPKELAEVTQLVREIDNKQSRATAQVRVVPLKNALADDLTEFLNSVIQGVVSPAQTGTGQQLAAAAGGGANQALRDAKSMVLEFLTSDGAAQKIVRSGVLSDIRISGDVRSNTLTVTAPEASMPLILELITVLDQPTSAFADIKAFTLTRADAVMAAELLTSLFPETEEGQPGVQLAGADGFGSALIPLRVSVDTRTNTVVAVGSPEVLRMVEAILFRIDQDASRNRRIEVLRLRNSPVEDVALAINQFLQSQRELLQIDPDRISTSEILEQEVIVTAEPISNN
jgi:type II secretory pathway component GspD/PulD (secretin)